MVEEKVLSQEEVSALFDAVGGDESESVEEDRADDEAEGRVESAELKVGEDQNLFPLARSGSLSEEVVGTLSLGCDTFAHKTASALSTVLRTFVGLKFLDVEMISYRKFTHSLPEPSSMWYLRIEPGELRVGLCVESAIVHAIISILMGGKPTPLETEHKVTDLEQRIFESMVQLLSKELETAWSFLVKLETAIDCRETRPRLLQFYSATQPVFFVRMKMTVGKVEGHLFWGFPEPFLEALSLGLDQEDKAPPPDLADQIQKMKKVVPDLPTWVEARISQTPLRVKEILDLKAGDVVRLEHRLQAPLDVSLNDSKKFAAKIVISERRKAIQIV